MENSSQDNVISTAFGSFQLNRFPLRKNETLRAWDAADEYLLNTVYDNYLSVLNTGHLLVINDQFGALSCSLSAYALINWSDSYVSHLSAQQNLEQNNLNHEVTFLPATTEPKQSFSLVLIRVPKSQALLTLQLSQLRSVINSETIIIAAGMSKYIHRSTLQLFENILGPTETSLAVKKSRLIFTKLDQQLTPEPIKKYQNHTDKELGITLYNQANVFAREKFDIGARFFIQQFSELPQSNNIIDLGCGNGILGIMAKRHQPQSNIHFADESYMAVDSARYNYQKQFPDTEASYYQSDSLSQTPWFTKTSATLSLPAPDLILCNPPFHQQHTISDHIAWRMFTQSKQVLAKNGGLWVIGNRHLNYHIKLKRLFGDCQTIAGNKKFVVLAARKA